MPFTSDSGKFYRRRLAGLRRAAFWKALGNPNLVLARAKHSENARLRREAKALVELERKSGQRALLDSDREL